MPTLSQISSPENGLTDRLMWQIGIVGRFVLFVHWLHHLNCAKKHMITFSPQHVLLGTLYSLDSFQIYYCYNVVFQTLLQKNTSHIFNINLIYLSFQNMSYKQALMITWSSKAPWVHLEWVISVPSINHLFTPMWSSHSCCDCLFF